MWSRRVRKGALKIDSRCQSVRPSVRTRRVSTSTSHCETSGRNDRQQYVLRATDGRTNKQTNRWTASLRTTAPAYCCCDSYYRCAARRYFALAMILPLH